MVYLTQMVHRTAESNWQQASYTPCIDRLGGIRVVQRSQAWRSFRCLFCCKKGAVKAILSTEYRKLPTVQPR